MFNLQRSLPSGTGRRGFTLIELLVVISIIALLVGLLLPALSRARAAARATRCLGNLRNQGIGLDTYSQEFGGVIANGTVCEQEFFNGRLAYSNKPSYQASAERLFGWTRGNNPQIQYGTLQRYWFLAASQYISKQETGVAVWDDVFFCPDDRFYSQKAKEVRDDPNRVIVNRASYLMSDTAFWDPSMFTDDKIGDILEPNQLYTNSEGPENAGPSGMDTSGRRYLKKEELKFPTLKTYVFEVNAFHEEPTHGYNERNLQATVLMFDGSADKRTASSVETPPQGQSPTKLYIPLQCRMAYTEDSIDDTDPLWWYYSTTRNGIRGRDFYK